MAELLKALPKIRSYDQFRQVNQKHLYQHPDLELNIVAARTIVVDATMFIPIDAGRQLCIFVHKYRDEMFLDIRIWVKSESYSKFVPTKQGIRIPIKFISQLSQRLNWLNKKYGARE